MTTSRTIDRSSEQLGEEQSLIEEGSFIRTQSSHSLNSSDENNEINISKLPESGKEDVYMHVE
jgi:hypothetical protein